MENQETKRFGRYEILGELGRGAMGVVYKARDPQIDRLVALKTVSLQGQEPERDEEFRQRFFVEAQAAGRLHHPGIVAIFDAGEDPETHNPYIVLEYVAGESLSRILSREKKLPPAKALHLAEEIATALDYAHEQGVVHRDIKPANILITADGHAKIADLGIAKLNLAQFTLPGHVLGTPAYMAPEQLSGEGVDGRSDLFSLGVILYAMVTGHSPFHGNSATTVCFKVVNREPVPASALDLDLPRALDAVISRAIAKDPNARYQRGSDFAADLQQLQKQHQPGSTTTSLNNTFAAGTRSRSALSTSANMTLAEGKPSLVSRSMLSRSMFSAIREAPLRGLIVGAALMLTLVLFFGNPFGRFAASRKTAAEAQSASTPSPVRPAEEYAGGAQPMPAAASPAGPTVPAVTGNVADKPPQLRNLVQTSSAPRKIRPASTASLDLSIQHQFKDATLSVWIDNKLTLTQPLHGTARKHMIVFNGIYGANSKTVQVPAGVHVIRLRAESADESVDLSKTISAAFTDGDIKTLQVTFNNHNTAMNLIWR
ncbi:MAG: protein kinase [Candidatus Sulfotelmatobacter sp.]|jgi:serine/threonine protein kinase